MWSFGSSLFPLTWHFWGSAILYHVPTLHSPVLLCSAVQTGPVLFTHLPVIDIWVASTFGLLWVILIHRSLCEHIFHFTWEISNSRIVALHGKLVFSFLRNCLISFQGSFAFLSVTHEFPLPTSSLTLLQLQAYYWLQSGTLLWFEFAFP